MFCVKSKLNMLRVFKNRPMFIHKSSSKKLGCKNVVNKISKESKVPKATSKFKNRKYTDKKYCKKEGKKDTQQHTKHIKEKVTQQHAKHIKENKRPINMNFT